MDPDKLASELEYFFLWKTVDSDLLASEEVI